MAPLAPPLTRPLVLSKAKHCQAVLSKAKHWHVRTNKLSPIYFVDGADDYSVAPPSL